MTEPTTRAARRAATAQRILEAAQAEFGERGFEATTVRAIAQRAGVDPSLVIQHYGSKADLFAIAIELDGPDAADVAEHLFDVLDVRLDEPPPETRALVRSMLTAPEATAAMKAFLDERTRNLARTAGDDPDAPLRAALTVASILGLTVARHFLHLDALAEISDEQVRRVLHPWLTAALGPPPQADRDRT